MDAGQWPQEVRLVKLTMEGSRSIVERKPRPEKDQALNCPRCNSTNTKFCYYNNYSLSQPRYFCKSCRRYWTNGGSLRSVPVGGGSRKNRRSSSSSTRNLPSQNPKIHHAQDLNLAYPPPPLLTNDHHHHHHLVHRNPVTDPSTSSFMELLEPGTSSTELGSFMSMPLPNPSTGLFSTALPSLPEFKSTLSFAPEGYGSEYGSSTCPTIGQGLQESSGARVLFPLEELKPQVVDVNRRGASLAGFVSGVLPTPSTSTTSGFDGSRSNGTSHDQGFWNGMFGGGGSW